MTGPIARRGVRQERMGLAAFALLAVVGMLLPSP